MNSETDKLKKRTHNHLPNGVYVFLGVMLATFLLVMIGRANGMEPGPALATVIGYSIIASAAYIPFWLGWVHQEDPIRGLVFGVLGVVGAIIALPFFWLLIGLIAYVIENISNLTVLLS